MAVEKVDGKYASSRASQLPGVSRTTHECCERAVVVKEEPGLEASVCSDASCHCALFLAHLMSARNPGAYASARESHAVVNIKIPLPPTFSVKVDWEAFRAL